LQGSFNVGSDPFSECVAYFVGSFVYVEHGGLSDVFSFFEILVPGSRLPVTGNPGTGKLGTGDCI